MCKIVLHTPQVGVTKTTETIQIFSLSLWFIFQETNIQYLIDLSAKCYRKYGFPKICCHILEKSSIFCKVIFASLEFLQFCCSTCEVNVTFQILQIRSFCSLIDMHVVFYKETIFEVQTQHFSDLGKMTLILSLCVKHSYN